VSRPSGSRSGAGDVCADATIAAERGELAPRLVATTVVAGVREVYAGYEARPAAGAPSLDDLLALIDRVLEFARTGAEALDT
jgi:hypothetical protein